jgi:hypothetical protein
MIDRLQMGNWRGIFSDLHYILFQNLADQTKKTEYGFSQENQKLKDTSWISISLAVIRGTVWHWIIDVGR